MQKPNSNQSFQQKFPDSKRGEMKARASFLGASPEMAGVKNQPTFKNLEQELISPTKGGKVPFQKTPRTRMSNSSNGEHIPVDNEHPESSDSESQPVKSEWKHVHLYRLLMSKLRNKR